ncbi:DUF2336 domain-containing protein [Mesorhizobium sp. LHD-90]|uniref:DUF2336 domain-containing protein n=1 Tax=Mesorhizobium sp. LHD-90 TaxID=3071414 RepID=UPI0027E1F97D|nr:DUF2336 domain-containing protein [Mesorhizobium sp. LHD-90]MDQ6437968.1 DUF2336 domain-containing protein [Mesorhizobium sp. LHD-90]
MIVSNFLKWVHTARVTERAHAAGLLARAFVEHRFEFEDRCAAEAALTLLLDDPSWKVRLAMAEALSMSPHAPRQVVAALAADQPEVASLIIGRSPLITDLDLIDRVAAGSKATQVLIARRCQLSMSVSAALAEVGEAEACLALLTNAGADIASISFRRIAERFGDMAAMRERMIADPRLPSDCRHMLLCKLGDALSRAPLVRALMGTARAERVTRDACVKASLTVVEGTRPGEHSALIEHFRLRGDLTASFLIRTVAHGKIDFFGSALVALTGHAENRVRALLSSGGDGAVAALMRGAGLGAGTHGVILRALKVWREVARGKQVAGVQEVSWLMLKELGGPNAQGDLAGLLKSIHLDVLRENARFHALAIAAA